MSMRTLFNKLHNFIGFSNINNKIKLDANRFMATRATTSDHNGTTTCPNSVGQNNLSDTVFRHLISTIKARLDRSSSVNREKGDQSGPWRRLTIQC